MDVIYLVRPGDHNPELRWSLRTLTNLPHDRVVLVGHRPPWVTGVEHIGGNRHRTTALNVHDNLAVACAELDTDRFVVMNDDFYIMRPVEQLQPWARCDLDDHIAAIRGSGPWRRSLVATRRWLADRGFERPRSFELHVPVVMDTDRLAWILDQTRGPAEPPQWRTVYGNHFWHDAPTHPDGKACTRRDRIDLGLPFLSSDDHTWGSHPLGQLVRDTFNEPCRYEATPPEEEPMPTDDRVRMTHPKLGVSTDVSTRRARVLAKNGWIADPDSTDDTSDDDTSDQLGPETTNPDTEVVTEPVTFTV